MNEVMGVLGVKGMYWTSNDCMARLTSYPSPPIDKTERKAGEIGRGRET